MTIADQCHRIIHLKDGAIESDTRNGDTVEQADEINV
jgi:hypothetical protein